ncbi:MAG: thioredoxin family protein [Citrobacter freundii]|nr:MAG: thioredoxin family protein [Citrobacter freundii]
MRLTVLLLSFFVASTAIAQTPSADLVLKEATATAAKEKKNVFIIFHASWCVWCHRMDTSMNDKSVKAFFDDNYVIRHLTVLESPNKKNLENPGAEEMMEKYNGKNQGIPYWLIFDNKGKFLFDSKRRPKGGGPESGDNTGCPASKPEVDYFVSVLKQTSKLTDKQLAVIYALFRKNEH